MPFGSDDRKPDPPATLNTPTITSANTSGTAQNNGVGSLDPRDLANPPAPGDGITVDPPAPLMGISSTSTGPPPDAFSQAGRFEPRPGGMLGSLGLSLETYFAEDIQDPMARIKRLERALTAIQGDLKTVAPPIQRLVAVESDIQELVGQLEVLLESEAAAPQAAPYAPPAAYSPYDSAAAAPPAPLVNQQPTVSAPPVPPPGAAQAAPPPASGPAGAAITSLRIGEHPGKIRLVLDVSGDTAYRADLDNNEKILVIELPDAGWSTAREMTYGKTPVLQGYRVDSGNGGKGSMLILSLKQGSTILYQSKIDALSGTGKRIVVDLAR